MTATFTTSWRWTALGLAMAAIGLCVGCGADAFVDRAPSSPPNIAAHGPTQSGPNTTASSNTTTAAGDLPHDEGHTASVAHPADKPPGEPEVGTTRQPNKTSSEGGEEAIAAPMEDPLDSATGADADEPAPKFVVPEEERPQPMPTPPEAKGLKRFSKTFDVWLDVPNKRIVLGGKVARNRGQLEMFACLRQTKEHESVVSVNTKAQIVHALLVLIGADPGHPVEFRPKYRAAAGPEIEVTVYWTDKDGKRRHARGQDWVRNVETGKALEHPWVFGGSGFWQSRDGKEKYYLAEDGDFICVSNFPSAMLDLPIESQNANNALLFEAFKDRVPERGTPIVLVLHPKAPPAGKKTPAKVEPIEAP